MENKDRYYLALAKNKDRLNEMDLGEMLGFEDEETRQIITQLLAEHRVGFFENGKCQYRIVKGFRGENRKVNFS